MIRKLTSKKRITALGILVAMAAVVGAVAFFTSTGSGTGSASVGSSANVTLHGTATSTLYPGTSSPVTLTVDNPGPGHEYVGTIHLDSVSADAGHATCGTSDFTMPDVTVNTDYAAGNGQSAPGGTLTMANTAVSQDACQNATLTLHLSSD